MSVAKKRVVVFISGGGSNMARLVEAAKAPGYPATIVAVFSDNPQAGGLARAAAEGIATFAFPRRDFADKAAHEAAILAALDAVAPDLVCLAGYMRLLSGDFIRRYEGRILNIHPSLLPLFPGLHTHRRALDAGMRVAGCTVHFVTEGMDEGPIVGQAAVSVLGHDTAESLAARVLTVEHRLYPQALAAVAAGRIAVNADGRVAASADGEADIGAAIVSC